MQHYKNDNTSLVKYHLTGKLSFNNLRYIIKS